MRVRRWWRRSRGRGCTMILSTIVPPRGRACVCPIHGLTTAPRCRIASAMTAGVQFWGPAARRREWEGGGRSFAKRSGELDLLRSRFVVGAPHPDLLPARRLRRRKGGEKEHTECAARVVDQTGIVTSWDRSFD